MGKRPSDCNALKYTRNSAARGVAPLLKQSSFSPQNELRFKAGLLAQVHPARTPSRPAGPMESACARRLYSRSKLLRVCTEFPFHRVWACQTQHLEIMHPYYTPWAAIQQGRAAGRGVVLLLIFAFTSPSPAGDIPSAAGPCSF